MATKPPTRWVYSTRKWAVTITYPLSSLQLHWTAPVYLDQAQHAGDGSCPWQFLPPSEPMASCSYSIPSPMKSSLWNLIYDIWLYPHELVAVYPWNHSLVVDGPPQLLWGQNAIAMFLATNGDCRWLPSGVNYDCVSSFLYNVEQKSYEHFRYGRDVMGVINSAVFNIS